MEMTRTKDAYPHYYTPLGGFMPFPPRYCELHKRFIEMEGMKWIDNIACETACSEKCERRITYDKSKEWYREAHRLFAIRHPEKVALPDEDDDIPMMRRN